MSKIAGISWFARGDYSRAQSMMSDNVLPKTYDEWSKKAEAQERRAKDAGFTVLRAKIDPDEFASWCQSEMLDLNAKARTAFAADFAARQLGH